LHRERLNEMLIGGEARLRRALSAYSAITIKRARTWHYRKIRRYVEFSNCLVPLLLFSSWPRHIKNTVGSDFRKRHGAEGEY
jgi:hypothetical protein